MSARTALSFSRDLEFATATELAKRMGCPRYGWLRAAVKELVDNSLDAAEEAGIEPEVTIAIEGSAISVADNGPGMPPQLVEQLCIRSQRTSTREAYAAPDRGSQGNALSAVMALAFGFDREQSGITITSQGVEHAITLRVNRLEQRVDLERTIRVVPTMPGTMVTLNWPEEIDANQVHELVVSHCWLNPQATSGSTTNRLGPPAPKWRSGRSARRPRRTGIRLSASPTGCCWRSSAIRHSPWRSS